MIKSEKKVVYLFLAPTIAITGSFFIYLLVYNLYISFHDYFAYRPDKVYFIGIANYVYILLGDPAFIDALKVTLTLTLGLLAIQIPLATGIALLLNKATKGIKIFRVLLVIPLVATPVTIGLIFKMMFHPSLGILNYLLGIFGIPPLKWLAATSTAFLAIILTDTWAGIPFMTLMILAGLQAMPKEPFEAAIIDGASKFQIFRYIILPLLKQVFIVAIIIKTIFIFRMFDLIYVMTSGGPGTATTTLGFRLFKVAFNELNFGYGGALAMIIVLITFVFSRIYARFI